MRLRVEVARQHLHGRLSAARWNTYILEDKNKISKLDIKERHEEMNFLVVRKRPMQQQLTDILAAEQINDGLHGALSRGIRKTNSNTYNHHPI